MTIKFNINVQRLIETKIPRIVDAINESLDMIKTEIDVNTPEETYTLIKANKIEKAQVFGNTIVGRVINKTPYVEYVEKSSTVKRYFKGNGRKTGGTPFKVDRGARMFEIAFKDNEQTIISNIRKSVG